MAELKAANITRFEAKRETEDEWTRRTHEEWDATLFPTAKSWYQGGESFSSYSGVLKEHGRLIAIVANIPGRKVEPLNWAGGIPAYIKALDESMENSFQGWYATAANEEPTAAVKKEMAAKEEKQKNGQVTDVYEHPAKVGDHMDEVTEKLKGLPLQSAQ